MIIDAYSPTIRRKEMSAVLTALVAEKIGPGEQAQLLASIAKEHCGFDYCLALRSPAVALSLALRLLDLEPGDGVLVSALSPAYYGNVIGELGLRPVFCDVIPEAAVIHLDAVRWTIEHAQGVNVRAMALAHPLGFLPDMEALAAFGLPIIEDVSTAFGSALGGRKAGSFGRLTILGLEERDMLTAGGGALLYATERRDAHVLRNHANLPAEYGLPDMNAALAVVQFREAARNSERRSELAALFTQAALRCRHKLFIQTDGMTYNNYAFPLVLETGMKDVLAYARRKEIEVTSAFTETLAGKGLLAAPSALSGAEPSAAPAPAGTPSLCPEAASLSLRTALFPLYPRLGKANAERVAKLIQTLP